MLKLHTKFEVSMFINYKYMKGSAKLPDVKYEVVWGLGVTEGHRQCHRSIKCLQLPIQL